MPGSPRGSLERAAALEEDEADLPGQKEASGGGAQGAGLLMMLPWWAVVHVLDFLQPIQLHHLRLVNKIFRSHVDGYTLAEKGKLPLVLPLGFHPPRFLFDWDIYAIIVHGMEAWQTDYPGPSFGGYGRLSADVKAKLRCVAKRWNKKIEVDEMPPALDPEVRVDRIVDETDVYVIRKKGLEFWRTVYREQGPPFCLLFPQYDRLSRRVRCSLYDDVQALNRVYTEGNEVQIPPLPANLTVRKFVRADDIYVIRRYGIERWESASEYEYLLEYKQLPHAVITELRSQAAQLNKSNRISDITHLQPIPESFVQDRSLQGNDIYCIRKLGVAEWAKGWDSALLRDARIEYLLLDPNLMFDFDAEAHRRNAAFQISPEKFRSHLLVNGDGEICVKDDSPLKKGRFLRR